MSEEIEPTPVKTSFMQRRFPIYAGVLLAVFLLGFIPMWLRTRTATTSLAQSEHQLMLSRLQSNLASGVIDARRGDYEPARQAVSQFFTTVRSEVDKGDSSIFTAAQRNGMQQVFAGRDEIITLLARSDPASADRLSDLFVAYRKIMSG